MAYFSGRVHTVVYEDSPNAFYILKVMLDDQDNPSWSDPLVTVKGHVPGLLIEVGTWFGFEADWVHHPKFGQQLSILRAPVLKDGWEPDTAERMLIGYGVGEALVQRVREHYGDDGFIKALGDRDKLRDVEGMDGYSAGYVAEQWASVVAHFKALEFLADIGLPNGVVRRVWVTFGDDAVEVLSKNPWALVQVEGIKFEQADEVARRLGLELDCPERLRGAVLFVCKSQRNFGHLYIQTGGLFTQVRLYSPHATKEELGQALVGLHKEGLLVLDKDTRPGTLAVYEPWNYRLEEKSAEWLQGRYKAAGIVGDAAGKYVQALGNVGPKTEMLASETEGWGPEEGDALGTVVAKAVDEWGELSSIKLTEKQRQGVVNALLYPVSVLAGLPGTGKTTSLRAAVSILQDAEVPFLLCAPTGIAAKRLTELTGAQAYTIHRAFAAKGVSDGKRESRYAGITGDSKGQQGPAGQDGLWGYSPSNPHSADVVIVDESSMLDQHLLYRLLFCTKQTARLVFVGDHAQLPSVGPGNVLRDLIHSGHFPVVRLTEIFRQEDTSDIVFAAHDIHAGQVPETPEGSDFRLISVPTEDAAAEVVFRVAEKLYLKRANFQILSPRHKGTVGVTNLNDHLRELLNPQTPGLQEVKLGRDTIREDDRVMVVKNNYKHKVFNGDVGKISRVNRKGKDVEILIFGNPPLKVTFQFKDIASHIRLAYACTVHKAQGLEYDVIVMPLVDGFRHQLQRNLLYTAVTRARKKVVLVGTPSALAAAVMNNKEDRRNTLFTERLSHWFSKP